MGGCALKIQMGHAKLILAFIFLGAAVCRNFAMQNSEQKKISFQKPSTFSYYLAMCGLGSMYAKRYLQSCCQRIERVEYANANTVKKWICKEETVLKKSEEPCITWIGHATALVQIGGINILTDPVFGNLGAHYQRLQQPGIKLQDLPKIHYIIISHDHRDHLEKDVLAKLVKKQKKLPPTIFVPKGVKKLICYRGWLASESGYEDKYEKVQEFLWGDNYIDEDLGVEFTFLPAYHCSGRGLFLDVNASLCGSWMIEHNGFRIYFAGDSGYKDHFKKIGKKRANKSKQENKKTKETQEKFSLKPKLVQK